MAELITLTSKTRGRNSKEVEFKGLGRVVRTPVEGKEGEFEETVETNGVLTTFEDALNLPGIEGNIQRALDLLAIGYNKYARDAALDVDEFAAYLDASWDEKKQDAFKRSVRAFAKVAEIEISEAAEFILAKMKKAEVPA